MEAPSWKQQLAVASLVALIAATVARYLIPGFFSTPGLVPEAAFRVSLFLTLYAFVLPLLWWRTTAGYVGAMIMGILSLVGQTAAVLAVAAAGALSTDYFGTLVIPTYILALLLLFGSALAWREA